MGKPKQALRGLGRGLSSLMEEMGPREAAPGVAPQRLPVSMIDANPDQPRKSFDDAALAELAESIRYHGVLQPLLVRSVADGRYQLVAGERRWRAAQVAGLHEVPVYIRDLDETAGFEAALIENIQRADLNPLEEALAYRRLMRDYGHTQEGVASATGKSRPHIANLLRLLDLPDDVRAMVADGRLSAGHAKVLAGADDPAALAARVVAGGLSVRATEALMKGRVPASRPAAERHAQRGRDADLEAVERSITDATGLPVSIDARDGAGSVTLRFSSLDQLDLLIARLTGGRF